MLAEHLELLTADELDMWAPPTPGNAKHQYSSIIIQQYVHAVRYGTRARTEPTRHAIIMLQLFPFRSCRVERNENGKFLLPALYIRANTITLKAFTHQQHHCNTLTTLLTLNNSFFQNSLNNNYYCAILLLIV